MIGRTTLAIMISALAIGAFTTGMLTNGTAEAGTLRAGTWVPTGCGTEPTPPTINASGRAAYEASIKDAQTYQQAAKQYDDCFFKEADADNHLIAGALKDHHAQLQATFDKLTADSKAAADRLNKKQ